MDIKIGGELRVKKYNIIQTGGQWQTLGYLCKCFPGHGILDDTVGSGLKSIFLGRRQMFAFISTQYWNRIVTHQQTEPGAKTNNSFYSRGIKYKCCWWLFLLTGIRETFYRDNIIPRKQIWLRTRNPNLLRSFIILTKKCFQNQQKTRICDFCKRHFFTCGSRPNYTKCRTINNSMLTCI